MKKSEEDNQANKEEEIKISFDNQSLIGFAILNRIKQCPNWSR